MAAWLLILQLLLRLFIRDHIPAPTKLALKVNILQHLNMFYPLINQQLPLVQMVQQHRDITSHIEM